MDKTFGERMRKARLAAGLTQESLAAMVAITEVSINRYEMGHRVPNAELINRLAVPLKCSMKWLITGNGAMQDASEGIEGFTALIPIPVFSGKIPAGFPKYLSEDIAEYICLPDAPPGSFAIRVSGDSMNPAIKNEDYVLFVKANQLSHNDVVIVRDEWGEVMIKRYREKDGDAFFVSDNPEYPIIKAKDGHTLVGKVIAAWNKRQITL